MPTTLVLPPQAGGALPVEVRVEFHVFVLGPELPAPFEVRAMEDPSERQAITCRVVSRGGVVPGLPYVPRYLIVAIRSTDWGLGTGTTCRPIYGSVGLHFILFLF